MSNNIEQKRASFAISCVEEVKDDPGKYGSYVSAMPSQIISNGLGQTIASLLAAAGRKSGTDDPHYRLCQHVGNWLQQQGDTFQQTDSKQFLLPEELLRKLMDADQDFYFQAQIETLAFLNWLKKMARAQLAESTEGNSPT